MNEVKKVGTADGKCFDVPEKSETEERKTD